MRTARRERHLVRFAQLGLSRYRMTTSSSVPSDAASTLTAPDAHVEGGKEQLAAVEPDKLPGAAKAAYALGGTTDIFGHWLYNTLANPVFNVFLGLSPTQVGSALLLSRLVDAFTDPLFGWLSDNTRSRWGRRRPYILFGSIIAGLGLPCLFMASPSWSQNQLYAFVLISACLYSPLISAYNMPYQSLGAELTPDYNERTSVLGWKAVTQKLSGMAISGALWFATRPMWNDPVTGKPDVAKGAMAFAAIAGGIMMLSGLANFIFVRERYYAKAKSQAKTAFFHTFKTTMTCRPYVILLGTALVYAIPTALIGSLGFYVTTYHVFNGDMTSGSEYLFWSGMSYALVGVAGVPVATALSKRYGKPKALTYTLLIGLFAFVSSWWFYTPAAPWLSVVQSGLNGFSATGLWVILPSMCVDVVDYDERASGQRREGAYQSTFAWVLKVGMAVSMGLLGPMLDTLSGFDAKLGAQTPDTLLTMRLMFVGLPTGALLIALVLIQFYPLTRERMLAIRTELEARRGTV
jgi:GPH family glycoside/pentoside/hexuronide:cation symporter